ncbi:MAG: hypothetical protein OMM_06245 [Candidatus Magnetoglobus multicellularis str. Araruama]|uniref:histidine kinase n=1 Tax=Candidatus Magnetoglobus multicellularis str. Araruama TaxID=890399 RepID=A0A1V1PIL0_9BACT|nr:MAG: hypothetical protein OMM_06245 [Candidatus Magnetoglobus multicellularis str. Araruama]
MSNAIKYSPFDTTIYVLLKQLESEIMVSVRDEGPGISQKDQTRMFGHFQKLSARPTGGEKSIGLGLAIVKKIIDAHQGRLEVHSDLGEGATFLFALPV